jgi:Tfp pilus assembly protein PilO
MVDISKLKSWKTMVAVGLGALFLIDVVLLLFLWHLGGSDPNEMRRRRADMETTEKLLRADIHRGEHIQKNMPVVGKDAEDFYKNELPPATDGYSAVIGDLTQVATKAGLRTSSVAFHEHELKGRGVVEVEITENVDGDYPSVLKFIQGIEQSKNFYLLNDLGLDSVQSGNLRLNLQLHTYFRSAT